MEEVTDIEPLLRLDLSKKSLKRMARAYGVLNFEAMRAHVLGGMGPILEKKEDMMKGAAAQDGVQRWLDALNVEAEADVAGLKKGLLEASEIVDAHLGHKRAWKEECQGNAMAQEAYRRMGDYTDQLYRGKGFTFNMYYKCSANKTWDNPKGCCSVIRSDRWTQLLTCAQEAAG